MALIVEDGTGVDDANSYATIAEADALLLDRNNTAWFSAADDQKVAALLEATEFVESYDYKGWREFAIQALKFPRLDLYDEEGRLLLGVPAQVKRATILLAGEALAGTLKPSTAASSGAIKRKRVGTLELEYFEGGSASVRSFPEVSSLLRGLVAGGAGAISGKVMRWS